MADKSTSRPKWVEYVDDPFSFPNELFAPTPDDKETWAWLQQQEPEALRALSWSLFNAWANERAERHQLRRRTLVAHAGQSLAIARLEDAVTTIPALSRTAVAKRGASAKLANDPKQLAKRRVRELWEEWQTGARLHSGAAAFARFVVGEIEAIQSTQVVERWCRTWTKEKRTEKQ